MSGGKRELSRRQPQIGQIMWRTKRTPFPFSSSRRMAQLGG